MTPLTKNDRAGQEKLRRIPAVQTVLRAIPPVGDVAPKWLKVGARQVLAEIREELRAGSELLPLEDIRRRVMCRARDLAQPRLRPVINATGILVHTNLGRSPLPPQMMAHLSAIATRYSTLEYRLQEGVRGSRHELVEGLLAELVGAEAAMVVNNNAAAVLLALSSLAPGREVIVSRGELVEIGGSFRIPEVMALSGARLVEVGATNKTHLSDYEQAIGENTALLLKVHQSNFRQVGFVESISGTELVALGKRRNVPVMEDLGSGVLLPIQLEGHVEPQVQQVVGEGMDITTFSGDKLLGGPQAGLIVGRQDLVAQMKKNPLARAVRVDKMTLAVLELVLRWYYEDRGRDLPLWRMIYMPLESIFRRSEALIAAVRERYPQASLEIESDWSEIGGGSMPGTRLKTWVVALSAQPGRLQKLESALRAASDPVIIRMNRGKLLLDLRTVFEEQDSLLSETLADALMRTEDG